MFLKKTFWEISSASGVYKSVLDRAGFFDPGPQKFCVAKAFGEHKNAIAFLPEGREQRGFCVSKTKRASATI